MAHINRKSADRINDVIDKISKDSFRRAYYYAVATLLREIGHPSAEVKSLFSQGGSPLDAAASDLAHFAQHCKQADLNNISEQCSLPAATIEDQKEVLSY